MTNALLVFLCLFRSTTSILQPYRLATYLDSLAGICLQIPETLKQYSLENSLVTSSMPLAINLTGITPANTLTHLSGYSASHGK